MLLFPSLGKVQREIFQSLEKPGCSVSNPWKTFPVRGKRGRWGGEDLRAAAKPSMFAAHLGVFHERRVGCSQ